MKNSRLIAFGAATAALFAVLAARPAFAQETKTTQDWPPSNPTVKVTPLQAMAAAKAKLGGGTAFSANFEFDEGHWVYGVMVVKGHSISEVTVDPLTGKATDSEALTPVSEAKEAEEELAKIQAAGG